MDNTKKKDTVEFNIPTWLIVIIVISMIAAILFFGSKSFGSIFLTAFPSAFLEVFVQILIASVVIWIIKAVFSNPKKVQVKKKSTQKKVRVGN